MSSTGASGGRRRERSTWIEERALPAARPTKADLEHARELREALRALLRANNLGGETSKAVQVVNAAATRAGVVPASGATARLRSTWGTGTNHALGRVIVAAYEAMLDGSWTRLKACRQCSWVFYDTSKNRSGSWCSMQLCGNRTKTRAYRRRKSSGAEA